MKKGKKRTHKKREGRRKRGEARRSPSPGSPSPISPPPQRLVFIRQWRPLTPEEMAAAWAGWAETDPKFRALWDLLSHELETELSTGQGLREPHAIMQWHGRVQELLFLRSQILNLRQ